MVPLAGGVQSGGNTGGKHSLSTFSMETSTMDDITQYACYCVLLKTQWAAFLFIALSIKIGSIRTEES